MKFQLVKSCMPELLIFNVLYVMPDPKDVLNSSLILMGEIGGNDYNQPFFQGIKVDEIRPFVPSVISAISSGINVSFLLWMY